MLHDPTPCRFCPENLKHLIVAELESVWAVLDKHPVTEGHHLILPKRHVPDWFSMAQKERRDADALMWERLQAAIIAARRRLDSISPNACAPWP